MGDWRASMSRRRFFGSTLGVAVGAGLPAPAGQPPHETTGSVDQNPIRRRGVGLRALDHTRAFPA